MIVLGIDWGRRRTGLALSDEMAWMAHPLATLTARSMNDLVREISSITRRHRVQEIILGLPLNMDGSEGESARTVRGLAERLGAETFCPVILRDERLTSWEASRMRGSGSRRHRKQSQDQRAACLILQSYLNSQKAKDVKGNEFRV